MVKSKGWFFGGKFEVVQEVQVGATELAGELPLATHLNDLDHELVPAKVEQQRIDGESFRFKRAGALMVGEQFAIEPDLATVVAAVSEGKFRQVWFGQQIVQRFVRLDPDRQIRIAIFLGSANQTFPEIKYSVVAGIMQMPA